MAGVTNPADIEAAGRQSAEAQRRNEQVIRSRTRNEDLSSEEVRDLIAYGARDSDVPAALRELAELIRTALFPRLEEICQEAIDRFGHERMPD